MHIAVASLGRNKPQASGHSERDEQVGARPNEPRQGSQFGARPDIVATESDNVGPVQEE